MTVSRETMSPLQVEILLWYSCRAIDFRNGDFSAPAVREAIDEFLIARLLRPSAPCEDHGCMQYVLANRGRAHVDAILQLALPDFGVEAA